MNRLILLDSGPLGMVTHPKATGIPFDCQLWLKSLLRRGKKNEGAEVIVATTNVSHLSRFITALDWQFIE